MVNAICPYCHKELPKFPTRKGNCPFCKHTYLVRTDPDTKTKIVVDETGAKRIEKIYRQQAVANELERNLRFNVSDFDSLYKATESELTQKWMPKFGRGPSHNDVLWGVAGRLIRRAADTGDFSSMSRVYFDQALYIHNLGKDCHYLLKPAKEMELREIAKSGFKEVFIIANQSCEVCHKLDGKKYSIEEALATHPLPCLECKFKLNEAAPTGWCRCLYQAAPVDFNKADLDSLITFSKPEEPPAKKGGFFGRFR